MLPTVPGQIATVLVAFATTGLSPSQMSVGNDNKVPPPATEFMAPAANAEPNAAAAVKALKVDTKLPAYTAPFAAPNSPYGPGISHFSIRM